MRHTAIILSALVLFLTFPASAQDAGAPSRPESFVGKTKVEAFLTAQAGLLVKDFYEIGSVAGDGRVDVYAVVFTKPAQTRTEVRGLRVEVTSAEKPERVASSYVDIDELEVLSRGLAYMTEVAAKWKGFEKQEYTEVDFTTRDDLRVGFYQRRKSQGAFVSSGPAPAVQAFFDARNLTELKRLIDEGARVLDGE